MKKVKKIMNIVAKWVKKRPLVTFLVIFGLFLGLVVLSNFLRQPQPEEEVAEEVKTPVTVYEASQAGLLTSAKVVNKAVIEIMAQSAGVVQKISVREGQKIGRGAGILSLSNNYQGGNASALQLQIAEKNWLMTHANFWDQEKVDEINYELGSNTAWVTQWETNPNRAMGNGDAYTAFTGQQNQELLDLSTTMTQRGQQLGLDTAESNYFSAQIAASLMRPASPVAGTVEQINVRTGQLINPGQTVAVIRADKDEVKLNLSLSETLMQYLNVAAPAWFEYQGQSYQASFDYLPTIPTSGNTYAVNLTVAGEIAKMLTNNSFVPVHLPLDTSKAQAILVPLNCIYQTQNQSFIYVLAQDGSGAAIARQKEVTLGAVVGNLVAVSAGLEPTDQVIVNNNLLDGQKVEVQ